MCPRRFVVTSAWYTRRVYIRHRLQEKVTTEMAAATENISRTRSRIVQSPERIKRIITTMGNTATEDKRTVAANEAKTRDLQTKIAALLNIEKVMDRFSQSG